MVDQSTARNFTVYGNKDATPEKSSPHFERCRHYNTIMSSFPFNINSFCLKEAFEIYKWMLKGIDLVHVYLCPFKGLWSTPLDKIEYFCQRIPTRINRNIRTKKDRKSADTVLVTLCDLGTYFKKTIEKVEKWKITVASKKLKQDLESVIAMYTT